MNFLKKMKKKGFQGCMKYIKYKIIKCYNKFYFYIYKFYDIDEYSIVFESEGDCCDNSYALFDYMRKHGYLERYNICWLVEQPENFQNTLNVKYLQKDIFRNFSSETIKALRTCRWYIYDHCNIMESYKKRENQQLIYLSHGWGYKAPKGGTLNDCKSVFDYMIATGPLSAKGLSKYWKSDLRKTIVTGYPRLDYFFMDDKIIEKKIYDVYKFSEYKKVIFWMPTFRKSIRNNLSENYKFTETGLPIFSTLKSLKDFDELLLKLNTVMVLKVHHLQSDLLIFNEKFSNILVVHDEDLQKKGIQLYQLIKYADALISDYSSISIDFLLLNRPIIFTLDDYEEYNKSRGLFPENAIDYMPGYHAYNAQELANDIFEIVDGKDRYLENRRDIVDQYHTYQDGNSSKRILEQFGI